MKNNARPLGITATAGTKFSRDLFYARYYHSKNPGFNFFDFCSPKTCSSIRLSSIVTSSAVLISKTRSGPCFSPCVIVSPLRPIKYHDDNSSFFYHYNRSTYSIHLATNIKFFITNSIFKLNFFFIYSRFPRIAR